MLAHLPSLVHSRSLWAYTGNRWVIMNCQNIDHRMQASPWNKETSDCKCEWWWEHENNQICSLMMFFHHCFSPNYDISGVCCCRCLTGGCATKHTNTVRTKTLNTTKVGGLILIQLSQLSIWRMIGGQKYDEIHGFLFENFNWCHGTCDFSTKAKNPAWMQECAEPEMVNQYTHMLHLYLTEYGDWVLQTSKQHQITCLYLPLEHIIEFSVHFLSPHLTCKIDDVSYFCSPEWLPDFTYLKMCSDVFAARVFKETEMF